MIRNGILSLEGVFDLHVHSGPSLFARVYDDIEMAREAAGAGMKAVAIKNHFESTVGRAHLTAKTVPGIKVFGGIVLNTWTGGFNPVGVEANLLLGGKFIWMPTTTAANHIRAFGGGSYTSKGKVLGPTSLRWSPRMSPGEGLTILEGAALKQDVKTIVELAAEYDAILGTSHLSKPEIFALVRYAKEVGVEKTVITHPFWKLPGLNVDELKKLIDQGAYAELVAICHVTSDPVPLDLAIEAIRVLGAERIFISSDTGAGMFPRATEALRLMAQWLFQAGISEKQLRSMMIEVPERLVGIS